MNFKFWLGLMMQSWLKYMGGTAVDLKKQSLERFYCSCFKCWGFSNKVFLKIKSLKKKKYPVAAKEKCCKVHANHIPLNAQTFSLSIFYKDLCRNFSQHQFCGLLFLSAVTFIFKMLFFLNRTLKFNYNLLLIRKILLLKFYAHAIKTGSR